MNVFVSSLITGMEPLRAAAKDAIATLRHEPVMAENFGARANSPQVACLSELRQSDVVVLILGAEYGALQPSGLSATHEEYETAKGKKYIFAFVQEGIERDAQEAAFVDEVQKWETGLFRGGFKTANELRQSITRALHDHALANVTRPIDQQEMAQRAVALLPTERRGYSSNTASLSLALAGGPLQPILRPVEIEKSALADALTKQALFGNPRLFDITLGVKAGMDGDVLHLHQERGGSIVLNEQGSVVVSIPIERSGNRMPDLVHEVILGLFSAALDYIVWVLDTIDKTERLTHVALAATITGADHLAWRTQKESDANPNRMTTNMGNNEKSPVQLNQTRAALRLNAAQIVEDLVVPLRRQWR